MIRHGESEDNLSRLYSRKDTRLTERARRELVRTRKVLEDFQYDRVYISPLVRARETADILGLDGELDPRLAELDFGSFEGHSYDDLKSSHREDLDHWLDDYLNNSPPAGESGRDLYLRVEDFLEEKLVEDKNLVLVTHDGVIKGALSWVFKRPDYFFKFKLDNGSISVISIDEGFRFIKKLNYI